MNARIINNVEHIPNIVVFDGEEYDLQLSLSAQIRIEERFESVPKAMEKIEQISVAMELAAILINDAIVIKNHDLGTELKPVTADYIMAKLRKADEAVELIRGVGKAFGYDTSEAQSDDLADAEGELDAAISGEEIDEKN